MYTLGIDLGSSSVKASLLDCGNGKCVSSAFFPETEMAIQSPSEGFAEQNPQDWYDNAVSAVGKVLAQSGVLAEDIKAIGIAYQMHGLVIVDDAMEVLRPAIIWCDSRAVALGDKAFAGIGKERCLERLLNSPGNFTAAKLAWVKENEPDVYKCISKVLLPGDWLAMKMTGQAVTTCSGLSEGIFWDFAANEPSADLLDFFGFDPKLLAQTVDTFGIQGELRGQAVRDFGLSEGTPVTYRAGDQPNNALSLGVFEPGVVAATAGTSGVVYAVSDQLRHDPQSRINRFVHVNHAVDAPRIGSLMCVNGAGIMNSWLRQTLGVKSYVEMNHLAEQVAVGSEGLGVLPFGNGAERILGNTTPGAQVFGLDLLRHGRGHLCRAAQEGIACAFRYGMDMLRTQGFELKAVRAGYANMFMSDIFAQLFAGLNAVEVELYETDGALGAARGAGVGAGIFSTLESAFESLECRKRIVPVATDEYEKMYDKWLAALNAAVKI